jgi:methyltransferase (TIGR00027 family)
MKMMEEASQPPGASAPLDNPYLSIRTRFLDDWLLEVAGGGIRQVVVLAAGMDARAFRLSWPKGTTVFEVERREVLTYKEKILSDRKATPKAMRRVVPVDLRDDFARALRRAGFDAAAPAAFLIEGLLVYLPDEPAALRILREVAALSAPGSGVALDIAGQTFLESPWLKAMVDKAAAAGVAWTFGTDQPEDLLQRAGFAAVKVMEPGEVGHGRWPYPVLPRSVPDVPRTYLVTAWRR